VLVSHSNSGIYVRSFETRNVREVGGVPDVVEGWW
jgi:hypothetical protein